ncbi:MAG: EAL domain-containing protein [Oleibacter sp.]|nr:EAL domain-containing protein [Thalassolituus sp.]
MALFKNKSIRHKLIIISLITTGLTLLLSNLAYISLEYYVSRQETSSKLEVFSRVIAKQVSKSLMMNDSLTAKQQLKDLEVDNTIFKGCIYDSENTLLASYYSSNSRVTKCPSPPPFSFKNTSPHYTSISPIKMNNINLGWVYLEANQNEWLMRFYQFSIISLGIFFASLFVAFLLASRLRNIVSRPITELSNTLANIVNNKNYSLKARKIGNDEIGALVDLFNSLMTTLQEDNRSLKASEELFRKLTALSPVGIFQVDPNLKLQYVNQRWRDIHNLTNEYPEIQDWFELIHPSDVVSMQEAWNSMIYDQESIAIELRFQKSELGQIWIQLMASPLLDTEGNLIGYLGAISDISELKDAHIQMENLAFYDPLTGLANRRLFKNRLEKSVKSIARSGASMALMFLDMDQFKRINDTLGHDAGDILLKEVANRLNNTVRKSDTVSRIGGDEFTILLTDIEEFNDVKVTANKILKALARPIRIKGQDIVTSVSIGITITPDDSTNANTLMKNADLAMYHAKEMGRNNFQFFSEEMNHTILRHLALEKELKEAIEKDQFTLLFQPKISLFDYKTTGVETLIRWRHPERGLLSPDYFIPVAEETGQIIDIGNWVLKQACHQISALIRQNILSSEAKVAVNLSAKQFADPYLAQRIRDVLEITKIPPHCLELEITESTLMEDVESAIEIMQDIKLTGVSIAIDDFGTGYSSLSYIKRFPIDVLKVDRSFVMDIPHDKNDMAITAAVIAMAHKLSLNVVAEGVETEEQLKFLRQNNCDEGQGYFFSRPLSLGQLHQFLTTHHKLGQSIFHK